MFTSPSYVERLYAGVLGKIIGVYLGRPFEGWTHHQIDAELGEIWDYVHDRLRVPLVVADDDISGTFTFLRALPDHGGTADITPEQIGLTWLNYIVENRSILWICPRIVALAYSFKDRATGRIIPSKWQSRLTQPSLSVWLPGSKV